MLGITAYFGQPRSSTDYITRKIPGSTTKSVRLLTSDYLCCRQFRLFLGWRTWSVRKTTRTIDPNLDLGLVTSSGGHLSRSRTRAGKHREWLEPRDAVRLLRPGPPRSRASLRRTRRG